ncbi:MAG TPA: nicotinate phosphoribosyltransferase [Salinivirga sp.]|uniref:nicotinate phosphoribosyltransferase n=1 Tax=Salinivirga sp. TaxID=1970192 RepID=UPI002B486B97|nr:nicotinate phosphoribosyltransferase [Salinivirga sp.]HKK58614.1 nicotinate phosphoribosyltransferase [Salinivirga sp.]
MLNYSATYTDQYQLTMAEVYFQKNRHNKKAVFDYFFRKPPFNSGYTVFAGLDTLLDILENFRFTQEDIDFLYKQKLNDSFLDFLKQYRFSGDVYSAKEGEIVFPTEPVLTVEAEMLDAQLVETLLLNVLNFQSLIATKAARMRQVAGDRGLIDFGLRRAQSAGAYHAARAAIIGGFNATSNVVAGKDFGIAVSGTMAHSLIQSYEDELTAFRHFAEIRPHDCVLLVDTYNTLKSGLPNTIKVAKEMEARGQQLKGIRLDSGDLAFLSRKARKMLDDAGLQYVKIAASNQLDECLIKSLNEQGAQIDLFGVGTSLVTGQPDSALDGVFKLAAYDDAPRIKISESTAKITLPGQKQVYRMTGENGVFVGADAVCMKTDDALEKMYHPFDKLKSMNVKDFNKEPLLHKVMSAGKRLQKQQPLTSIQQYASNRIGQLPAEYKRFENPHIYKVGLSEKLNSLRNDLIHEHLDNL